MDRRTVLETVNLRDVRMVQRGQRLRFAREAREPIGNGRKGLGQDLQGHVAIEFGVARAIHLAHASGADGRDDLVGAESCSWGERQDPVDYRSAVVSGFSRTTMHTLFPEGLAPWWIGLVVPSC